MEKSSKKKKKFKILFGVFVALLVINLLIGLFIFFIYTPERPEVSEEALMDIIDIEVAY